jgi:hypothetical protein
MTTRTVFATNAYAAKREIVAALRAAKVQGSALADALISYGDPGVFGEGQMIYGGGIIFEQPGEEDLVDGPDILIHETAVLGLHIRVEQSPLPDGLQDPVEATDQIAEGLGDEVARLLAGNRQLAGGMSISRIVGGQCDHNLTDTSSVSVLTLRISIESDLI